MMFLRVSQWPWISHPTDSTEINRPVYNIRITGSAISLETLYFVNKALVPKLQKFAKIAVLDGVIIFAPKS